MRLSNSLLFRTYCSFNSLRQAAASTSSLQSAVSSSSSSAYIGVDQDLELNQVIVIHRHGDRAQITRELGSEFPENSDITDVWTTKLPVEETLHKLGVSGIQSERIRGIHNGSLYTGWDTEKIPYAMLTELGSQQLIGVGERLRARYLEHLAPSASSMYCRSTDMCRTILSLRSFLAGFLQNHKSPEVADQDKAIIHTYPKIQETLFPQANGVPCLAMAVRRNVIMPATHLNEVIPDYEELEAKVKRVIGYGHEDKVSWLSLREVLTCHSVHTIDQLRHHFTTKEIQSIDHIAGYTWGVLYNDDELNRLAIGRFLGDLQSDMNKHADKSLLVYSGHDSTLVPVLCALGLYDNVWPPYASYLAVEIATSKVTGRKFVRAVFNDEVKKMDLDLTSTKEFANAEVPTNADEVQAEVVRMGALAWSTMENFNNRLRSLSMTEIEYDYACERTPNFDEGGEGSSVDAAIRAMELEIRATIDGKVQEVKPPVGEEL